MPRPMKIRNLTPSEWQAKRIARFWSHVDTSGGPDACWPWLGGKDQDGYGKVKWARKDERSHRVAFFLEHGRWPIPFGCHSCDNRICTNPRHIWEGDHLANMADMVRKGRRLGENSTPMRHPETVCRGEAHGLAKLTLADVQLIRSSNDSGSVLGARFGVSSGAISSVRRRRTWNHVT